MPLELRERESRSKRSNESGGEFVLLQEMTGRKPEGGEERELIYSRSTHTHKESRKGVCKDPSVLKKTITMKKKTDTSRLFLTCFSKLCPGY